MDDLSRQCAEKTAHIIHNTVEYRFVGVDVVFFIFSSLNVRKTTNGLREREKIINKLTVYSV